MELSSASSSRRWVYAAKLASWPKLLVPMVLGQAIGIAAQGGVNSRAVIFGTAFTICNLLYLVFLNDWGDRRVDGIKREMFPDGCSAKTIPDGLLRPSQVLWGALSMGGLAIAVAVAASMSLGRPASIVLALSCLVLLCAYTLPPLKLNYRGGGEYLEALGVGLLLPCFQCYLQSGELWCAGSWFLPGFMMFSYASAVASGLADEESDKKGGKHTYVTEFGNEAGRAMIERCVLWGVLLWGIGARLGVGLSVPTIGLAVAIVILNWKRMRRCSAAAKTNAFRAQGRYKHLLHNAIWRGTIALSLVLLFGYWRG